MKNEELRVKSEKLTFDDEEFLKQYLAGKAPLHADRLKLPSEEELDAAEAEFDKMVTAHKRPARLLPLWPWVGAAVAAMLVMAFLLWPEKPMPVSEEVLVPTLTASLQESHEPQQPQEPQEPSKVPKPPKAYKKHKVHKVAKPQPSHEIPIEEPMLAQAEPQQEKEEEAPIIPPDKQALADIFLAEEALQVAYELRAQQEAIRAYAASLTGEEQPQPIIAF